MPARTVLGSGEASVDIRSCLHRSSFDESKHTKHCSRSTKSRATRAVKSSGAQPMIFLGTSNVSNREALENLSFNSVRVSIIPDRTKEKVLGNLVRFFK